MEHKLGKKVQRIALSEYAEVLPAIKHVFLVGDLQKPTPHPFIREQRVELIVCSYQPNDNGQFHWHPRVTEYEWVVEGEIGYFEVATEQTHWFTAGDLIVIPNGVCVRRLVREVARTIALKIPSLDEKIHCAQCNRTCSWRVYPYQGLIDS